VKRGSGEIDAMEKWYASPTGKGQLSEPIQNHERATEIGPPAPSSGQHDAGFHQPGEKRKKWSLPGPHGQRGRLPIEDFHNPYFSSLLMDRKVDTPSVVVTGSRSALLLVGPVL